ncbi:phosphoenolpyruvate-dependent sugar PTS family porter, EIIA 2, partial [Selenomonas sp. FOBRC6]
MLNERCGEILHRILQSKTALRVEILAKDLGISERTIRYDLNRIDDYLNEQGLPPLSRKSREGISLHLTAAQVSRFQSGSYKEEPYRYVLSQKERIAAIAYTLLSHNDYIPVQRLADSLHVSKTTIYADIQEFKEQLDPTGRYVKTAKGKGVLLTGNESALRNLVLHSLLMNSDELNFSDVSYLEMFRLIPLERLQDFVKEAETQLNKFFSDYALSNMVLHLAIAVKRIQLGRTVEMVHEELSHLIKAPEFSVAAGIAARIEETCAIHIPESEIAYITIHLLGSSFSTETQAQDIYLQMVVSTLIARMCQECGIPFDRDEQLYENLGEHMGPAIYRFRHGININNPLIDEIKADYPHIFGCVRRAMSQLEKEWNIQLSDAECGYLSIHFLASRERMQRRHKRKARVLLICDAGIGTSQLILLRLHSIFDFETVGTMPAHVAPEQLRKNDLDLVVTTIPLSNCPVHCIQVTPFLTEKNISDLSIFFSQYDRSADMAPAEDLSDRVLREISPFCVIEQPVELRSALERILGSRRAVRPSLRELLSPRRILLNAAAQDWREAVRLGGDLLLCDGCITEHYIQAMQENIEKLGNYMILFPYIAMPHARPDEGALCSAFSIVVLQSPIPFGSDAQVQIIITLSAIDYETHT